MVCTNNPRRPTIFMLPTTWVESRRWCPTFRPNNSIIFFVSRLKSLRWRPDWRSLVRKLCRVFRQMCASSKRMSSACCHNILYSSCSRVSSSVRSKMSFNINTPRSKATGILGAPLFLQYKSEKSSSTLSKIGIMMRKNASAHVFFRRLYIFFGRSNSRSKNVFWLDFGTNIWQFLFLLVVFCLSFSTLSIEESYCNFSAQFWQHRRREMTKIFWN